MTCSCAGTVHSSPLGDGAPLAGTHSFARMQQPEACATNQAERYPPDDALRADLHYRLGSDHGLQRYHACLTRVPAALVLTLRCPQRPRHTTRRIASLSSKRQRAHACTRQRRPRSATDGWQQSTRSCRNSSRSASLRGRHTTPTRRSPRCRRMYHVTPRAIPLRSHTLSRSQ